MVDNDSGTVSANLNALGKENVGDNPVKSILDGPEGEEEGRISESPVRQHNGKMIT